MATSDLPQGYILAFDFGLKHIGVAAAQTITATARGVATVAAATGKPVWREIDALIEQYQPFCLVVGLPLNMDDSRPEICERAEGFAQSLSNRYSMPAHMRDERLTSKAAKGMLDTARDFGDADTDHELAACLIAEAWLSDPS